MVAHGVETVGLEPAARPERHAAAVHDAGDSSARLLADARRRREADSALDRSADDALGEDVGRQLVE